eukprot:gnl/TRDRNA2_/TRDRNA2_156650_c0_seq1.p1 gnl/TRDRNA2_/TRDRNA2_156650_c0~~gnl/TRDRNA2_/TRDRNA2_156650_c0_seq1.p1  ORF type:complete len:278 (-),score=42.05 gnl/TRDRNA2_/TRDRNA2_156650_c0_seq1:301-1134(-)
MNAAQGATDADGVFANVRILKINCVDFEETCQQQQIASFPTIRLYRRGISATMKKDQYNYVPYNGPRQMVAIAGWVAAEIQQRHLHTGVTYHDMFSEGCRLWGYIDVARVPGTLHLQAMHTKDSTLNLAFTNVSHKINHLSFGEEPHRYTGFVETADYEDHVQPLDGKSFTVNAFHLAPHHYLKVVHTRFETTGWRSYQQTHQWSIRGIERRSIPQAKFSYDLSPVEVVVRPSHRRWYDFVTSVLAIVGGCYTVLSMAAGVVLVAQREMKARVNKLG